MNPANPGLFLRWLLLAFAGSCAWLRAATDVSRIVPVTGDDLQAAIARAAPGDILLADPKREIVVRKTVVIDKPLTLLGLRARLEDKLGHTQILLIKADGVRLADFDLTGNKDSVPQSERAALVQIHGSRFVIERGVFRNSSKDGVQVTMDDADPRDVRDGVIRDIVGYDNVRDHVSISGYGQKGFYIRNLVVQNIRAYGSRSRGAVEVSDGTENITVQDVFAERSVYAVDVQDHSRAGESNRGVRLLNIFARNCRHAVRTNNRAIMDHRDLTLRNIGGDQWPDNAVPIQISNTRNVVIEDVRLREGRSIDTAIVLRNCRNVSLRMLTLEELSTKAETLRLEDCADVRLRDVYSIATTRDPSGVALLYRLQTSGTYGQLRIDELTFRGPARRIVLERARDECALERYRIHHEPALVDDRLKLATGQVVSD